MSRTQGAFKVLLIDDDVRVLERAKKRIEGGRAPGQIDPQLPIVVHTVAVAMVQARDREWTFADALAKHLADACTPPPDVVFIDYGYANPDIMRELRDIANKEDRELTRAEIEGKALMPPDLAHWVRTCESIDQRTRKTIHQCLFGRKGLPVYVYSYTSREFRRAVGEMSERIRRTRIAFPNARVISVDTREELYNSTEFDWPTPTKKDPEFYAFQVSGLLRHIAEKEILRRQLQRSRSVPIWRSARGAVLLTLVAAAIGFASQWMGGLVHELSKSGHMQQAVVFALAVGLLLFGLGFGLPLAFNRWAGFLPKDAEGEEDDQWNVDA
ncbi:hypothetical protein ACFL6M_04775 [Candidatus Eisenbacteria bacterium]|uniref:Response regulatory domain-containing protein n=1 Tax=Eiseniibacteriota bacterium TaxID=2212470 RepID=A0ABV6YL70_UNCEI